MKFAVILFFSLSFCIHYSLAVDDTLKLNQTLRDTGQTLVSSGKKFKLGFFNLQNSENRYVGIWLDNTPELAAVWVANRDNPLTDSSGILKITESGNILILSNKTEDPVWSSNSSAKDPTLQLLSTGNLVVKDGDSGNYAWQSFDHPCDSLIAGMKFGWDFKTGQSWKLNSWNNLQDPSTGIYTYEMDRNGIPQALLRRGQDIVYRNGPWDGVRAGYPTPMREQSFFIPNYVVNETHNYYSFDNANNSTLTRFYLNVLGSLSQERWDSSTANWALMFALQKEDCDTFARCGPNGICVESESSVCHCPTGFVPKAPEAWAAGNFNSGCILKTSFNCSANEGFKKFSKLKLPYNSEFTVNGTVVEKEECELICRRNCSCVAYAVAKVGGCVVLSGELFDMRRFSVGGQDVYIRMDASELKSDENGKKRAVIIAVSVVSGFVLLFLVGGYIIWKRRTSRSHISQFDNAATNSNEHEYPILLEDQLPSFGLDIVANATDNFSSTNKIGEGGFGPVYMGMLPTGQKIAVKRLSKDSGQGLAEFKNEVVLIAKLQHWNLVRLLGCCFQGEERMLIYEYMPNKSLDLYIFDQTRGTALNWPKRFDIIVGVARGLLYLHRDSRLRIIHRDLKASNILLDDEMNPKISDFGMARIFGGDQNEVNTKRVVGTYGYMSPEYVIDGHFSVKSDIFSFGVMVLEIVSGKKNRGFEHPDHEHNLLGHAWNLWNEGRPMELMDSLMENVSVSEVLRCIQVGLLCVQKRPEERPLMSFALSMLDSENASLPQPKQPGFYTERAFVETDSSSLLNKPNASTEITVTILEGR